MLWCGFNFIYRQNCLAGMDEIGRSVFKANLQLVAIAVISLLFDLTSLDASIGKFDLGVIEGVVGVKNCLVTAS